MENNQRKMNTVKDILSNRKINYVTYAMLISISEWDNENQVRYVTQDMLSNAKFRTKIKYHTMRNHINRLNEFGLIEERDKVIYIMDSDYYFLANVDTLNYLVNVSSDNLIKTYLILGSNIQWAKRRNIKTRSMTFEDISNLLGYSYYDSNCKNIVKDILYALEKSHGLIKIEYPEPTKTIVKEKNKKSDIFIIHDVYTTSDKIRKD